MGVSLDPAIRATDLGNRAGVGGAGGAGGGEETVTVAGFAACFRLFFAMNEFGGQSNMSRRLTPRV